MNTQEAIGAALNYVPANDRDLWLRIGMAVKSELGDEGFDLWSSWSEQDESFREADTRAVWKSIKVNGLVTIGTLFHEAQRRGFELNGYARPQPPTHDELAKRERQRQADEAKGGKQRVRAASRASAIWKAAQPLRADHPYLVRKQVEPVATLREMLVSEATAILGYRPKANGEPLTGRLIVVPVKVGEELSTLELIDEAGRKSALHGGAKAGGYWAAQPLPESDGQGVMLAIGEGVATVLSVKQAIGYLVIAALCCVNLERVAKAMRARYPAAAIVILAELGNERAKTEQAARSIGGSLAVPDFGDGKPEGATDFNDLARKCGAEAVRRSVANAKPQDEHEKSCPLTKPEDGAAITTESELWGKPQPLILQADPDPYPIDALPGTIGNAVREVQGFVQCPVSLAACSTLSALSVVGQAIADVRRATRLEGPCSLNLLAVAESGERKTTCDDYFTRTIKDWEREQAELMKPELDRYKADLAAWTAKREGICQAIKMAAKGKGSTTEKEAELDRLQSYMPMEPKVPRLIHADTTPEKLSWNLWHDWPSGGVISSEAGIVFGSHAMSDKSMMRNMALLNILWDGGDVPIDRKTSDSYTLRGARLTMGLAVQPGVVREFFDNSKGLARGSGFAARFLIAWPKSTQGERPYKDPPASWPYLYKFNQRIKALLNETPKLNDRGELELPMLDLSPEAKAVWINFHDRVERELRAGGDMTETRDVASKAADNAARLAALFHIYEHGSEGAISAAHMQAAVRIVAWHLYEARRFLGEAALPQAIDNAAKLDAWLLQHCRLTNSHSVRTRYVRQYGPRSLRKDTALDEAASELVDANRVRLVQRGRQKHLEINPFLLGESHVAA